MACPVCSHLNRWRIEDAYLSGGSTHPFTRQQVERHMSHLSDAESLRAVAQEASSSALAARLRRLEQTCTAILDAAIQAGDLKAALLALREARQTVEAMGKLAGHLAERVERDEPNAALDAALARALGLAEETRDTSGGGTLALPAPAPDDAAA